MKKLLTIMLFSVAVIAVSASISSAEDKGDAAKGKESYDNTCVACHGPKPRNLSDPVYVSTLSNEHLYKVISEGGASVGLSPMMAAWGGVLSEQQIWDVLAFIHTDLCKCEYKAK